MALEKVPAPGEALNRAVKGAVNYLIGEQEANGGWLEAGTEYPEVGSEIIQAIYDYMK